MRGAALHVLAALERAEQLAMLTEAVRLLGGESGNRLDFRQAMLDPSRIHHMFGESSRARLLAERAGRESISVPGRMPRRRRRRLRHRVGRESAQRGGHVGAAAKGGEVELGQCQGRAVAAGCIVEQGERVSEDMPMVASRT
ncbi:MAG: hypothetical protein ACRDP6_41300 [Actinoallomurus sp.]